MSPATTQSFTAQEFAAYYKMSVKTVHRLKDSGKIPFFRLGRRIFLLPIDEQKECRKRAK